MSNETPNEATPGPSTALLARQIVTHVFDCMERGVDARPGVVTLLEGAPTLAAENERLRGLLAEVRQHQLTGLALRSWERRTDAALTGADEAGAPRADPLSLLRGIVDAFDADDGDAMLDEIAGARAALRGTDREGGEA